MVTRDEYGDTVVWRHKGIKYGVHFSFVVNRDEYGDSGVVVVNRAEYCMVHSDVVVPERSTYGGHIGVVVQTVMNIGTQ